MSSIGDPGSPLRLLKRISTADSGAPAPVKIILEQLLDYDHLYLAEHTMYGSSRLSIKNTGRTSTATSGANRRRWGQNDAALGTGPVDVGHKPGYEWRTRQDMHSEKGSISYHPNKLNTMDKKFKLAADQLRVLIPTNAVCIASDRITVDGKIVGFMYRETPEREFDSGWCFMSGDETDEYADNADNFTYYKLNTIANYDEAVIPYLESPIGSQFERLVGQDKFMLVDEV